MRQSQEDSVFVFTDLDDTLFQTRHKCPEVGALFEAAVDRQGRSLGYFTPQQKALVRLLEQGTVIPVTGRNAIALERVHLEFSSYRITSHGALILGENGLLDEAWWRLIRAQHEQWIEPMATTLAHLSRIIAREGLAIRCRLIEDQGIPVYVSIKGEEVALGKIAEAVRGIWSAHGTRVHRNGQNMALLPPFAHKEQAVGFLMERLKRHKGEPLFIGIGDSMTDLPFLRLCHYALIPQRSQIQEAVWD
jgi:hydroxymethylpyrimidine pyrophosphatase-like HAD family hydrolase